MSKAVPPAIYLAVFFLAACIYSAAAVWLEQYVYGLRVIIMWLVAVVGTTVGLGSFLVKRWAAQGGHR
jgi:hypothetical protein